MVTGIQWNPDFLNPRFLKNPNNSNQKSFPLDLLHCNFTPNISNSRFLKPIFVSLGGSRNRNSTVHVNGIQFGLNSSNHTSD